MFRKHKRDALAALVNSLSDSSIEDDDDDDDDDDDIILADLGTKKAIEKARTLPPIDLSSESEFDSDSDIDSDSDALGNLIRPEDRLDNNQPKPKPKN